MRNVTGAALGATILLVAGGEAAAQDGDDDGSSEFELRRVMLSTGGVGYFEYETRVSGETELSFRVRRDQVDDVLKSVVVYDDEGRVGTISLPGQEPLRETFRGLPFEPEHLSSPAALLGALQGAEVRVSGTRETTGRLLSVTPETVALPDRGTTTRHRVSLVTPNGIQQVVLEDVGSIAFTDPELSADVEAALAAIARLEDADSRTLTVTIDGGTDERTVRVAYVVEVPLWKATYRLTLSDEPGSGTASLQGWAMLENLTGEDWNDVELSLVSGHPVTFRQALYDAYYVDRPEVPVEVLGRVLPRVDSGSIRAGGAGEAGFGVANAAAPSARARAGADDAQRFEEVVVTASRIEPSVAGPAPAPIDAAESTEAAAQVLFRVPRPVTVAAGDSVLVPIVARDVPARRVSLYQPDTHPRHPLASVLLTNDTGTGLPPGVLTLYERDAATGTVSHVGDARLSPLPAGEERLLSFAVDQEVTIDREERAARRISRGRIVDGVLELGVVDRQTTQYLVAAAPNETRDVVIEHPRREGWDLVEPSGERELTETAYRLPVTVAADETVRLDAVLERSRMQRVELAPLTVEQIRVWIANDELSEPIRAALRELAELREEVAESERALRDAQEARGTLVGDQERIRENLAAVPDESDLSRRYLDELSRQEDRIAELDAEIEGLRDALAAAQRRVAEFVRTLSL
ncbi:MAG TPA: DUF4139 domain-containing protein [Gammaproteobacteria bacterium]